MTTTASAALEPVPTILTCVILDPRMAPPGKPHRSCRKRAPSTNAGHSHVDLNLGVSLHLLRNGECSQAH